MGRAERAMRMTMRIWVTDGGSQASSKLGSFAWQIHTQADGQMLGTISITIGDSESTSGRLH